MTPCHKTCLSRGLGVYIETMAGVDGGKRRGDNFRAAHRDLSAEADDAAADVRDELARADETAANERDRDAEIRDAVATGRDRAAADPMTPDPPASLSRRRAAEDREEAAADRDSAFRDRTRSRRHRKTSRTDRERAAGDRSAARNDVSSLKALLVEAEDNTDDMLLIEQAQDILMAERGLDSASALLELCGQATRSHIELGDAARNIANPH